MSSIFTPTLREYSSTQRLGEPLNLIRRFWFDSRYFQLKIILNIFYLVVAFYGTLPLFRKELFKSVTRISIIRFIFIGIFILNILYIHSFGYNSEIDNGIFNLFTPASLSTSIKRKIEIILLHATNLSNF